VIGRIGSRAQAASDLRDSEASRISRLGEHADAAVLRDRAGRPTGGTIVRQPGVSGGVVNVSGVEQRYQDVDIE
jgi:hypothetical protein